MPVVRDAWTPGSTLSRLEEFDAGFAVVEAGVDLVAHGRERRAILPVVVMVGWVRGSGQDSLMARKIAGLLN
jgi:hypothetical protein